MPVTNPGGGGGGGGLTNINVSAGTTSNNLSNIVFSNSNGVTFGLNGSTITASAVGGGGNGSINFSAGTTSNSLSNVVFSNSNNVSFGLNGSTITATATVASTQGSFNISAGTTSNLLSALTFSNSNGVTFGLNASTVTASIASSLTNINVSAGTTSNNLSAVVFSNSNNFSFGLNGSTVTGSYTVPTVPAQLSVGNSNLGNTLGDTGVVTGRLVLVGTNNITLSGSTNAGSMTISISGPNAGGGGITNINVSAGTTSNNLSNITFSNSNGVSFGLNGSTLTASVATSLTNINVSAGTTSNNLSAITFSNSNGITFGLNASTITGSHNGITSQSNQQITLFATSNTTQSSTGTINASSVIFAGAGIASVGITNGSIVISVPSGGGAGDGGPYVGITNSGNTAGTSGTVSTGNYILVGSGAITLSQSSSGNNGTLTITVPQTSSIVGTNGLSVTTTGSTISVSNIEVSLWRNNKGGLSQAGSAQGNSLVSIQPFRLECPLAFSNILVAGSVNVGTQTNNSSAYVDVSASAVLYTRNISTLSSLASFNNTFTISYSSNNTGTVTGVQGFALTGNPITLTQGEYFIAFHVSTNNTATGGANTTALGNTMSMILADSLGSAANLIKIPGNQTAASLGLIPGQGIISTGATRASIAFSDYTMTGTRGFLAPIYFEARNQTWWG